MDVLKKLNEEGETVILITHDATIASRAKRIVKIVDGRIVADSSDTGNKNIEENDALVHEKI